jgi:transcription elongation factor GreA
MTEKGRANLGARLKELEAQRPSLVEALRHAREKGDLSENAEFDAAREAIAALEASINEVTDKLNRGQIVDIRKAPRGKVAFGATVKVLDLDAEKEETYTLCGCGEEDAGENWILTTSPLAQGLMLMKVGDEPEVKVPRGTVRYRILEITYPE